MSNNSKSTSKSFSFFLFFIFLTGLTQSLTESSPMPCYHIFKEEYAVFVYKHADLFYSRKPMELWNGSSMSKGVLYHNFCFDFELTDFCGVDKVKGRTIFVKDDPSHNESRCLLLQADEGSEWDFDKFESNSNILRLPGVRATNAKFRIYELGTNGRKKGFVENMVNNYGDQDVKDIYNGARFINNLLKDNQHKRLLEAEVTYAKVNRDRRVLTQKDNQKDQFVSVNPQSNNYEMLEQRFVPDQNADLRIHQSVIDSVQKGQEKNLQAQNSGVEVMDHDVANQVLLKQENYSPEMMPERHIGNEVEQVTAKYNFYCDKSEKKMDVHYLPRQKIFEINTFSPEGCVVNLEFLQVLNEYPIITGIVFVLLGIGLAFFGISLFKNLLYVFIPLIVSLMAFFLYFAFVEASGSTTNKIVSVGLLLAIMIGIIFTMIWCNWVIFFLISFLASFQLSYVLKDLIEPHLSFFAEPGTEWILFMILFILFLCFYFVAEDYFLILTTAITGAIFIVISLKFLSIADFDFLFDTQVGKWGDFQEMDQDARNMALVFIGVVLFGSAMQIFLLCRDLKKQEEEDEEFEHEMNDQHSYDPEHGRGVQLNGI